MTSSQLLAEALGLGSSCCRCHFAVLHSVPVDGYLLLDARLEVAVVHPQVDAWRQEEGNPVEAGYHLDESHLEPVKEDGEEETLLGHQRHPAARGASLLARGVDVSHRGPMMEDAAGGFHLVQVEGGSAPVRAMADERAAVKAPRW